MPGIVGWIGRAHGTAPGPDIDAMTRAMVHERHHVPGTYANRAVGLRVGWVSHAGSFDDCMPVWNETGDVCLVFSGEEFIEQIELDRLRADGHAFDPSNASYLVHLYEERGIRFLETLNGCFSGLLVDLRTQTIVLFNDRYGLRRLYWHEDDSGVYFASEAKALLRILPALRRLDLSSLADTFSVGCVLSDRTLFAGLELLPAGSAWTFRRSASSDRRRYFDPQTWEHQSVLTASEYCDALKETVTRIMPRYLASGRPVGMSLTGGMDGRMIMAWAKAAPGSLPCYTFAGPYRDCADVRIARRIAAVCGQSHRTITLGAEFFRDFSSLAERTVYLSDGTMDVSGAVELHVNKVARTIAPIRLTGNYGSEVVRGNVAFRPSQLDRALLAPDFARLVDGSAERYAAERRGHRLSFIAFKQVPWYHYSRFSIEQSQLTMHSPYLDAKLVSLMYRAPEGSIAAPEPSLRVIEQGDGGLARLPTDRGLLARPIPFATRCTSLYQSFTAKAEYAYDYGMPQWLAGVDHAFAPLHIERRFLGRHKFYHFRVWYRDRFHDFVRNVLLDPGSMKRPHINAQRVEAIVRQHTRGTRNYTSEIHRLLTAELTHRQLIEMR